MLMADCMSCHFVCLSAAPWHVFLCPPSLSLVIFPPLLLSLLPSQISVDHLCNCLSDCAAKQLFTYFLHSSSRTPTWSWSSSWSWSCCGNRIALPAVPAAALLIKFCAFRLCLLFLSPTHTRAHTRFYVCVCVLNNFCLPAAFRVDLLFTLVLRLLWLRLSSKLRHQLLNEHAKVYHMHTHTHAQQKFCLLTCVCVCKFNKTNC